MIKIFESWRRLLASIIPGTPEHVSAQKRKLERHLRDQGYSRSEAKLVVSIISRRLEQGGENK